MVHIILIPGIVPKKRMGKQPLANQETFFAELVVDRQANLMSKMQIQVVTLDLATVGLQQGRQGSQLDRWVDMEPEGHIDQGYFQWHGGIVPITRQRSTIKIGSAGLVVLPNSMCSGKPAGLQHIHHGAVGFRIRRLRAFGGD